MSRVALLFGIVVVLAGPVRAVLMRARWTERTPRAAIALFQAIGCTVAVSLIAAAIEAVSLSSRTAPPRRIVTDFSARQTPAFGGSGASPEALFVLTGVLIVATLVFGAVLARVVGLWRERAHRRMVIDLVSTERRDVPGVRILPHAEATAFSLAGVRPRVVVSTGTLELLSEDELAAVVAHERAHVHARHDLVLLPFCVLARALPSSSTLRKVHERVRLLTELAADDRALRSGEAPAFAAALCRVATASELAPHTPVDDDAPRRVERTLAPRPRARALACGSALAVSSVLALPVLALFAPFGGR